MTRERIRIWGAVFVAVLVLGGSLAAHRARSGERKDGASGTQAACAPNAKAAACAPDAQSAACAPDPVAAAACPPSACAPGASQSKACPPQKAGACDLEATTGAGTPARPDPAKAKAPAPANAPKAKDRGWKDLSGGLEAIRSRYRIPGLAAALVQDGRIVAVGVAGVRKAGDSHPILLDDRFHIGSCGKSFTATLAAGLVEGGAISWTTTLGEVFPELRGSMKPSYRSVTLAQLLAHRSGLTSLERGDDPMWRAVSSPRRSVTEQRQELVRLAVKERSDVMPGASFAYTDLGYAVAGRMLERASGKSWETLIAERIARPLGLRTLGFGAPGSRGVDQPWGHVVKSGSIRAIPPGPGADQAAPVIGPAGTIHLSIADWARYAQLHLESARRRGPRAAELAELYDDPYHQGYGMGWAVSSDRAWARGRLLSHTGSCGAWAAAIWIAPERNMAIVVASNLGTPEAFTALNAAASWRGQGPVNPVSSTRSRPPCGAISSTRPTPGA